MRQYLLPELKDSGQQPFPADKSDEAFRRVVGFPKNQADLEACVKFEHVRRPKIEVQITTNISLIKIHLGMPNNFRGHTN